MNAKNHSAPVTVSVVHQGSGSTSSSSHAAQSHAVPIRQPAKFMAYSRRGPMRSSSRANTGISGNDTAANPNNSEANAAVRFQS